MLEEEDGEEERTGGIRSVPKPRLLLSEAHRGVLREQPSAAAHAHLRASPTSGPADPRCHVFKVVLYVSDDKIIFFATLPTFAVSYVR